MPFYWLKYQIFKVRRTLLVWKRFSNGEYWVSKISRKRERDDKKLLFEGWTEIRFWGNDIKKYTDEGVRVVEETVFDLIVG